MRRLLLLGLLFLYACGPSRHSEPAAEPQEIRLDTPTAPKTPPSDTGSAHSAAPTRDTAQAPSPQKARRTPAAQPSTTAPAEGVDIRTEKKSRTAKPTPSPAPQQQSGEEGGIEIRTKKKERTP